MSYTQADLDNIRAAKLRLLIGERVDSVTIGTDTVRFAVGVTVAELSQIESEIAAGLAGSNAVFRAYAKNGGRG